MKIYTDLYNRTIMYNIPGWCLDKLKSIDLEIVTEYDDDVNVYWGDLLTKDAVLNLPNLEWIHFPCVGVNRALIPEVINKNITVTNSPGIFSESVSSLALSYILYFSKGLNFVNKLRRENNLTRESFDKYIDYTKELNKTKCLIVGMGNIGHKLKDLLNSLDIEVVGLNSKNINELEKYVSQVDFVVNLLPLTDETKHMFDHKIFDKMKHDSYFISMGRGQTVVEEDLIKSLKKGSILGCALDVFNTEPLPKESELWRMDNVSITPHIANVSKSYWNTQIELFISNVKRFRKNTKLLNTIDLNKMY